MSVKGPGKSATSPPAAIETPGKQAVEALAKHIETEADFLVKHTGGVKADFVKVLQEAADAERCVRVSDPCDNTVLRIVKAAVSSKASALLQAHRNPPTTVQPTQFGRRNS